ncbi:hexosaminidase [Sphingomonas gellani]|uniref:beta-N-acetylhexosaminidase n=2 Tax=Sphingomonas gellani TaxID=1166340 RepID=A0A1H8AX28_9SPHN|nr:hexosaminidase [Sphingomonas gellani]
MSSATALIAALAAPLSFQLAQAAPPSLASTSVEETARSVDALTQRDLDSLAADLGYRMTIVSNRPGNCPTGKVVCFDVDLAITTPARVPAGIAAAEIRFGFINGIVAASSDVFDVRLINGDLHRLSIKPGQTWAAATTYHVRLVGAGNWFSTYHAMPNAHIVAPGLQGRVIAASKPRVDGQSGLESLPFVAPMTDEALLATQAVDDVTRWLAPERALERYATRGPASTPDTVILPLPASINRPAGEPLDLTRGVQVKLSGVNARDVAPALAAINAVGIGKGPVPLRILVHPAADLGAEAYRLSIRPAGVDIRAGGAAGASYALRSLVQQAAGEQGRPRPLEVQDAPRLPFRGLHVDLGRNFHSRDEILKLIEQMATYKLNRLHLHLGDDEGWRLEIPALPELTRVGGYRCFDDTEQTCLLPQLGANPDPAAPTNGFLTQADYVAILHAARDRQIEVIPSFDMPGHSRAAIRSMEARYARLMAAGRRSEAERYRLVDPNDATRYRSIQNYNDNTLNVCSENTYHFVDTVIDAIRAMHKTAGVPLRTYHIGADETAGAWTDSPACRARMAKTGEKPADLGAAFIERVAGDLAKRGIMVAGWSDGLSHTAADRMPAKVQTNIWGGMFTGGVTEAHEQLNRGWAVVLSMPDVTYLDMPNAVDPMESGYDWGARETDSFKAFAFMPENLPANAALMTDVKSRPSTIADTAPVAQNRRIAGLQAQVWSETVRGDAQVDYMLFPRVLALAERAWHRAAWEPTYVAGTSYTFGDARVPMSDVYRDWRDFAGRAGAALSAMDRAGIAYRLAPPGARIANGQLEAMAELPGETIEYSDAGGQWRPYAGPVAVTGDVVVRTRSPDGRRVGRSVTVTQRQEATNGSQVAVAATRPSPAAPAQPANSVPTQ